MKCANALILVATLSLGVLLGIYARGGVEPVSAASPMDQVKRSPQRTAEDLRSYGSQVFDTRARDPRAQHRVRVSVSPDSPVTAVGIYGHCPPGPEDDPPGTFPPEECVFTVEAVQYRRDEGACSSTVAAIQRDLRQPHLCI